MLKLLGVAPSPYVRKAMLALAYKGVEYDMQLVRPGSDDPEFLKASPLGKIPAMITDTGGAFADSSVIIAYLERVYTANPLYPEDPDHYAKALFLEEYADSKLAEACTGLYFQRVVGPAFFNHTTDQDYVKQLCEELIPAQLSLLDSQLKLGEWAVGQSLTVADIAICAQLMGLERADFSIDSQQWPAVADLMARFLMLEITKAQLKVEHRFLKNV